MLCGTDPFPEHFRAKKYKISLYVNGKPLVKLIDPDNTGACTPRCRPRSTTGTPTGRGRNSRTSSPSLEGSNDDLPKKKRGRPIKNRDKENNGNQLNGVAVIDTIEEEHVEDDEVVVGIDDEDC